MTSFPKTLSFQMQSVLTKISDCPQQCGLRNDAGCTPVRYPRQACKGNVYLVQHSHSELFVCEPSVTRVFAEETDD